MMSNAGITGPFTIHATSYLQDVGPALLHQRIEELREQASIYDWNGDGGLPMTPVTAVGALRFVDQLIGCFSTPTEPELSVDNAGHFNLEIYLHDDRQALFAVLPDHTIAFAIRNGVERIKGYTTIDAFTATSFLGKLIRQLTTSKS